MSYRFWGPIRVKKRSNPVDEDGALPFELYLFEKYETSYPLLCSRYGGFMRISCLQYTAEPDLATSEARERYNSC